MPPSLPSLFTFSFVRSSPLWVFYVPLFSFLFHPECPIFSWLPPLFPAYGVWWRLFWVPLQGFYWFFWIDDEWQLFPRCGLRAKVGNRSGCRLLRALWSSLSRRGFGSRWALVFWGISLRIIEKQSFYGHAITIFKQLHIIYSSSTFPQDGVFPSLQVSKLQPAQKTSSTHMSSAPA